MLGEMVTKMFLPSRPLFRPLCMNGVIEIIHMRKHREGMLRFVLFRFFHPSYRYSIVLVSETSTATFEKAAHELDAHQAIRLCNEDDKISQ